MVASQKILVIEDHEQLNAMICRALHRAGFWAHGLLSAEEVSESPELHDVDIFLVDWNLPGEDGASLIKRLRKGFPNAGIVLLTAREGATNQIQGYLSGADLYLSKPIKTDELVQALVALGMRRGQPSDLTGNSPEATIVLNRSHRHLEFDGRIVPLSMIEIKMLASFLAAPSGVLEVWQLIEMMSASGYSETNRALEVQVSRLRKKLSTLSLHPNPLPFIRGGSYRLNCKMAVV